MTTALSLWGLGVRVRIRACLASRSVIPGPDEPEVHVRSPESNYQNYSLQWVATGLAQSQRNFTFLLADWTGSGIPDLWAIKKWATGTNSTEVHIYSGESNFTQAVFHGGTALAETGPTFDFDIIPAGPNAPPDLVAFKRAGTGTNSTEIHVLSGASQFREFLLQTGTALQETGNSNQWHFLLTEWNHSGNQDFAIVSPANGGELHVISGPQYRQFIVHEIVNTNQEFQICAPEADPARCAAMSSCLNAATSFVEMLGADIALSVEVPPLGIAGTIFDLVANRTIFIMSMMDCVRDVQKYQRETSQSSGRGGVGSGADPFPLGLPSPPLPVQPPGPVGPLVPVDVPADDPETPTPSDDPGPPPDSGPILSS